MSSALATVAIGAYLVGSVPNGVLLARLAGVDPRQAGSGNIGATNVARTAGKALGLVTLALDVAKGTLPVLIAPHLFAAADPGYADMLRIAAALGAVIGHVFSIALRFHGGKGVATGFGAMLVLAPLGALVALLVFVLVFYALRWVSLASIAAAVTAPLGAVVTGSSARTVLALAAIALIIIYRHRDNMQRILAGTEPHFGSRSATGEAH